MMNYMTNNNAGSGISGGLGGSGSSGTRSADYAAVLAAAGAGGGSPYGVYAAGFDVIPEEVSGGSGQQALGDKGPQWSRVECWACALRV